MAEEPIPPQETSTPPPEEVALAEWQEPETGNRFTARSFPILIVIPALLLIAGFIALGIWLKDSTYYLTAGVVLAAVIMIFSQNRHPSRRSKVILTNYRLQVGTHAHALTDLAGFWFEHDSGFININFEPKKRSLMPISVLYPDQDTEKLRQLLLQVMAEVEPRQETFANQVNRFFRM